MDNRYASLPLWNACDDASGTDTSACFGIGAGYARTHSGTLSFAAAMLALSADRPIGKRLGLTSCGSNSCYATIASATAQPAAFNRLDFLARQRWHSA
jgi:hypothetical protein